MNVSPLFSSTQLLNCENKISALAKLIINNGISLIEAIPILEECLAAEIEIQIFKDNLEIIETFLKTQSYYQSLLLETIKRSPELAKKLIPLSLSTLDTPNYYGETPLILACKEKEPDIVKLLLKHGAKVNQITKGGIETPLTPLGECIRPVEWYTTEKDDKIFNMLLEAGADPNKVEILQSPPLIWCVMKRLNTWAMKLFPLCNLEAENFLNQRAIHMASAYGFEELVDALIEKNVELNSYCENGLISMGKVTPCHLAIGHPTTLEKLIRAGADPHKRAINTGYDRWPDYGVEPISAYAKAVDKKDQKCIEIILKHAPLKQSDTNIGFTRHVTNLSHCRDGYASLGHRMLCQSLKKTSFSFENVQINTKNEEGSAHVKKLLDLLFSDKSGALSFYMPIWNAINRHAQLNKEFCIIFGDENTYSDRAGCYNSDSRNEVVISTDISYDIKTLATLVHELTHKCGDLIYDRSNLCAPSNDPVFDKAIVKDLSIIEVKSKQKTCKYYYLFLDCLKHQVSRYEERLHNAEYLARIPQIATRLAFEYGLTRDEVQQVMMDYIPNLTNFFLKEFLPACEKYAAK